MTEPHCLMCGRCCHLVDPVTGRPGIKTCKFLIKTRNGRTLCRIYNDRRRIGKKLDDYGNRCNKRETVRWDYEGGCPYNAGREMVLDMEIGMEG